jgi:hypothetical protein
MSEEKVPKSSIPDEQLSPDNALGAFQIDTDSVGGAQGIDVTAPNVIQNELIQQQESPSQAWERSKHEVSFLDPLHNVVDRVKIWWNGDAGVNRTLTALHMQVEQKAGELEQLQDSITRSQAAEGALKNIGDRTGIPMRSERSDEVALGGFTRAREQEQALNDSIASLRTKITGLETHKADFARERNDARGRIVERIKAKVDIQSDLINGYDLDAEVLQKSIDAHRTEMDGLRSDREYLELFLSDSLLPEHRKEISYAISKIASQEQSIEKSMGSDMQDKKALMDKRKVADLKRQLLQQKIAPPKTQRQPDIVPADVAVAAPSAVVLDMKSDPQLETVQTTADMGYIPLEQNSSEALESDFDDPVEEIQDAWDEADTGDRHGVRGFLKDQESRYRERTGMEEGNIFLALIKFFDSIGLSDPEPKPPKKKT